MKEPTYLIIIAFLVLCLGFMALGFIGIFCY